LVLKRVQDNGLCTVSLTTAGWPVQFGINSLGLGFGTTNLTPTKSNIYGIPYIAALSHISTMENVNDATAWLKKQKFLSGHSYILIDRNGVKLLETTPSKTYEVSVNDCYCQTNHYKSDIDDNSKYKFLRGSLNRVGKVSEAVSSFKSPAVYLNWLVQTPDVLRKPSETSNALSCAAYVIDITKRRFYFTNFESGSMGMEYLEI